MDDLAMRSGGGHHDGVGAWDRHAHGRIGLQGPDTLRDDPGLQEGPYSVVQEYVALPRAQGLERSPRALGTARAALDDLADLVETAPFHDLLDRVGEAGGHQHHDLVNVG